MTQAVGVDDAGALWTAPGGGSVDVDATLTQSGKAADAAAVGDALSSLSEDNPTTWAEFESKSCVHARS